MGEKHKPPRDVRDVKRCWLLEKLPNKKSPAAGTCPTARANGVVGYRLPFTLGHCGQHHIVVEQTWLLFRGMTMGTGVVRFAMPVAVRCQAVLQRRNVSIALTSDRVAGERNEPLSFFWNVSRRFTLGAGRKLNGLRARFL